MGARKNKERMEEEMRKQKERMEEEIKRMKAAADDAAARRKAEELRKQAEELRKQQEREEERRSARANFRNLLSCKLQEYYPQLEFEQLATGYDPFGSILKKHGDKWLLDSKHKHYHGQGWDWDPRK